MNTLWFALLALPVIGVSVALAGCTWRKDEGSNAGCLMSALFLMFCGLAVLAWHGAR